MSDIREARVWVNVGARWCGTLWMGSLALNPDKVRTLIGLKTNFRESPVSPYGSLGKIPGGGGRKIGRKR